MVTEHGAPRLSLRRRVPSSTQRAPSSTADAPWCARSAARSRLSARQAPQPTARNQNDLADFGRPDHDLPIRRRPTRAGETGRLPPRWSRLTRDASGKADRVSSPRVRSPRVFTRWRCARARRQCAAWPSSRNKHRCARPQADPSPPCNAESTVVARRSGGYREWPRPR